MSADIFRALRGENFLRGMERGPLLDRLTFYLGEANAMRHGDAEPMRKMLDPLVSGER